MTRALILGLMLISLVACTSARVEKVAFACPTFGTVTMFLGGVRAKSGAQWQIGEGQKPTAQIRETWLGSDPSDPEVCLRERTGNQPQRLLYGIFLLPMDGEDKYRSALREAFAGATHGACFTIESVPLHGSKKALFTHCIGGRGMIDWGGGASVFVLVDSSSSDGGFTGETVYFYDPSLHFFVGRNNSGRWGGDPGPGMRRTLGS